VNNSAMDQRRRYGLPFVEGDRNRNGTASDVAGWRMAGMGRKQTLDADVRNRWKAEVRAGVDDAR